MAIRWDYQGLPVQEKHDERHKYPSTLIVQCKACKGLYIYRRESSPSNSYWLSPERSLCHCFHPRFLSKPFGKHEECTEISIRKIVLSINSV